MRIFAKRNSRVTSVRHIRVKAHQKAPIVIHDYRGFLMCAQHALLLGGESPLQTWQQELLAKGKGVHRIVPRGENLGRAEQS